MPTSLLANFFSLCYSKRATFWQDNVQKRNEMKKVTFSQPYSITAITLCGDVGVCMYI